MANDTMPAEVWDRWWAKNTDDEDLTHCGVCLSLPPAWGYQVSARGSAGGFLACERCGRLIEKKKASALAEVMVQSTIEQFVQRGRTPEKPVAELRRLSLAMALTVINGHGPREAIGGERVTLTDNLGDMGPYSDALMAQVNLRDWWRTDAAGALLTRAQTTAEKRAIEKGAPIDRELNADERLSIAVQLSRSIAKAETFYVAPEIARFLAESAGTVDPETTFDPDDLPAQCGFVYLGEGVDVRDSASVDGARLQVMVWEFQPAEAEIKIIVDPNADGEQLIIEGAGAFAPPPAGLGHVIVHLYDRVDPRHATVAGVDGLIFRDAYTWQEGQRLGQLGRPASYSGKTTWTNVAVPTRQMLVALWTFVKQKVANETPRQANGLTRKRITERPTRRPGDEMKAIRVVHLRELQQAQRESDSAAASRPAGSREYTCRWYRRPHPRHVPCGPGRSERRLRWIRGKICGPSGLSEAEKAKLPLKATRSLFVVAR